jgi:AhpD family alkylhydroperoxidase
VTIRLNYWQVAPEAAQALGHINNYIEKSTIEPGLRHLVWLRISQINGCAYCVDRHSHDAIREGESQQRLDCLVVWREAPFYSERERAALQWAEAITEISKTHAPDEAYNFVCEHFSERELVDLTLVIATMNALNRMAIAFRRGPSARPS